MTMDGITTSFSLFFCNDLGFFFLLHYVDGDGDGNGNGGEVKQLLTWLTKLVGWCAGLLGAGKEPNQQGKSFFFLYFFFRTKSFPNEENLDSSLLSFSLFFFFISHHPSLPSSPSPTRYPLATPFLPSSMSAPRIFPFSSRSYAIDAPSASASA